MVKITEIKLVKYITDLKKKVKSEGGGRVKKLTDMYEIVSIFSSHGLKASVSYVRDMYEIVSIFSSHGLKASVSYVRDMYEIVSIFSSHGLKASANYVRGLQSFFQARYNEAK